MDCRNTSFGSESEKVNFFLGNSYEFKKLTEIYNRYRNNKMNRIVDIVESLKNAKSFRDVRSSLDRFDYNDLDNCPTEFESTVIPPLMRAVTFFASFIYDEACVAYYGSKLREKTLNTMNELGYTSAELPRRFP